MDSKLTQDVLQAVRSVDPRAAGSLHVRKIGKTFYVSGQVSSGADKRKLEAAVLSVFSTDDVILSNIFRQGLTVAGGSSLATTEDPTGELDEVEVLYFGMMKTNEIVATDSFKKLNHETLIKVKRAIDLAGFVAPLVLDSEFNVIDGNLRLAAVRKLYGEDTAKKIPVVVLNDAGVRADFLRLVLNRSSEFQRWVYSDVDAYVDGHPQLQPILEPLGFFSNTVLSDSFFGNTIVDYRIDQYNDQQKMYSQDQGLAAWAEHRTEVLRGKERARQAELERKRSERTSTTKSLFDTPFEESDLLETHDMPTVLREHALEQREVAGIVTDNYDAKRKAEKEAKGQVWQSSRRGSKQKAADNRAAAKGSKGSKVKAAKESEELETLTEELVEGPPELQEELLQGDAPEDALPKD